MKNRLNLSMSDQTLKKRLTHYQPFSIAQWLATADITVQIKIMKLLEPYKRANVFSYLPKNSQIELIKALDKEVASNILDQLDTDDLRSFLSEHIESDIEWLSALLSDTKREQMKSLSGYEDDMAAAIMSLDFITINQDLTIKSATNHVIKGMKEQDFIDYLYVTDPNNHLLGIVSLKDLIIARATDSFNDLITDDYIFVKNDDEIADVIKKVRDYDLKAIPVLSNDKQILGIITADDIILKLASHHDEDYIKFAGMQEFDEEERTVKRTLKKLPWLLISVAMNIVIAFVLTQFEDIMAAIIALTFFQPMLLGMAGNIGTQSLASTILGLNSNDLAGKVAKKRHIGKETGVAFINSLIIGIITFLLVFGFLNVVPMSNNIPVLLIAATVSISIYIALFFSALVSVFIPLLFNKMKIDPSAASGPVITTINDVFALFVYFGMAALILVNYLP